MHGVKVERPATGQRSAGMEVHRNYWLNTSDDRVELSATKIATAERKEPADLTWTPATVWETTVVKSAAPRHPGPIGLVHQRDAANRELPLRFLLITDQTEWPWAVRTLVQVMAPVDVVQVNTLANALWRLGRERFDSVLLHFNALDHRAIDVCRSSIADVAALPVLDLNEGDEAVTVARQDKPTHGRPAAVRSGTPRPADDRGQKWPPRAGRGRTAKPRAMRTPFLNAR